MKEWDEINANERRGIMANSRVVREIVFDKEDEAEGKERYDLDAPYQVITRDFLIAGSQESFSNFFDALDKGYFIALVEGASVLLDGQPISQEDLPGELVHVMTEENFEILKDDQFFGNDQENGAVFLQTSDMSVLLNDNIYEEGTMVARLVIDTEALFKKRRKIYIDEESLTETPDEYGKSFFMYGGIPRTAIKKVEIIEMGGTPNVEDDPVDGDEFGKKKLQEYEKRLKEVKERLQSLPKVE